jgi:hypothetical protein
MDVFSTELGIRLSFVETLEVRGGLNSHAHHPSVRHCLMVVAVYFPQASIHVKHFSAD